MSGAYIRTGCRATNITHSHAHHATYTCTPDEPCCASGCCSMLAIGLDCTAAVVCVRKSFTTFMMYRIGACELYFIRPNIIRVRLYTRAHARTRSTITFHASVCVCVRVWAADMSPVISNCILGRTHKCTDTTQSFVRSPGQREPMHLFSIVFTWNYMVYTENQHFLQSGVSNKHRLETIKKCLHKSYIYRLWTLKIEAK